MNLWQTFPQTDPAGVGCNELSDIQWYTEAAPLELPKLCHALESLCQGPNIHLVGNVHLVEVLEGTRNLSALFGDTFSRVRGQVNPFECLGKGPRHNPYINRSALKMVNMEVLFDVIHEYATVNSVFTFVDLCGGPGGFSEYLLSRCSELEVNSTGFAMSLAIDEADTASSCNWNLGHLHIPPHMSIVTPPPPSASTTQTDAVVPRDAEVQLYIVWGADGTGDMYQRKNVEALGCFVWDQCLKSVRHAESSLSTLAPSVAANSTSGHAFPPVAPLTASSCGVDAAVVGVDFVCADGGSAEGRDRHDQEIAMLPLLASQVTAMLGTLKAGGCFLLKVFSIHMFRTTALLFVISQLFASFTIVKPVTSRPTSSERYLFCRHLRDMSPSERKQLQNVLWTCLVQPTLSPTPREQSCADPLSPSLLLYVESCVNCQLVIQVHHILLCFRRLLQDREDPIAPDIFLKLMLKLEASFERKWVSYDLSTEEVEAGGSIGSTSSLREVIKRRTPDDRDLFMSCVSTRKRRREAAAGYSEDTCRSPVAEREGVESPDSPETFAQYNAIAAVNRMLDMTTVRMGLPVGQRDIVSRFALHYHDDDSPFIRAVDYFRSWELVE